METTNPDTPKHPANPTPPENNTISRRDFLKVAGAAFFVAPPALKAMESAFIQSLIFGMKSPDANDAAISAALQVSEHANNSENPGFRPMTDILKEGIELYAKRSPAKPRFERIRDYKGIEYYEDILKEYRSSGLLPKLPDKLVDRLAGNLPKGAFESFFQSRYAISSFDALYTGGSGFEKRFKMQHPDLVHPSGTYIGSDQLSVKMAQAGKAEITDLKNIIEEQCRNEQHPVSASFIFAHFLEKNDGDISLSAFDTAIFLKFMARNNPDTGEFTPGDTNIAWYRQHIKDEYQGPTYTSPPENASTINLIGKPYHSWNLVALLRFVPLEIVRIGGVQKQLSTFTEQGLGKTRADLQTLKDLRDVERYLLSFATTG